MFYVCKFNFCPVNRYRDSGNDFDTDIIAVLSKYPEANWHDFGHNPFSSDFQVSIVGEYATLDEARTAFLAFYPEHRDACDSDIVPLSEAFNGVVEVYKLRKFKPLGPEGSMVWVSDDMVRDVKAETTDEEISQLWEAYQQEANDSENSLDEVVVDALRNYRDNLCDAEAG